MQAGNRCRIGRRGTKVSAVGNGSVWAIGLGFVGNQPVIALAQLETGSSLKLDALELEYVVKLRSTLHLHA